MIVHSNILGLAIAGAAICMLCVGQVMEIYSVHGRAKSIVSLLAIVLSAVTLALVLNRFRVLGG